MIQINITHKIMQEIHSMKASCKLADEDDQITNLVAMHYPGGPVLETACGRGRLRDIFDSYIGIDLPDSRHSTTHSVNVLANAQQLPFPPKTFDFAFTVAALMLFTDPGMACREIWRCLRPGGIYLIIDYTPDTKRTLTRRALENNRNISFTIWNDSQIKELLFNSGFDHVKRIYPSWKSHVLGILGLSKLVNKKDCLMVYIAKKTTSY